MAKPQNLLSRSSGTQASRYLCQEKNSRTMSPVTSIPSDDFEHVDEQRICHMICARRVGLGFGPHHSQNSQGLAY